MQSNITYCFDTVEVKITTSDGGVSVSHVLLPTLSGTGVSIILESGIVKNAHFTATLLHESQLIATTNFCENYFACNYIVSKPFVS